VGAGFEGGLFGVIFGIVLDHLGVEVEEGGLADGGVVPQMVSYTHTINIIASEKVEN
jgi:hypothetical protein